LQYNKQENSGQTLKEAGRKFYGVTLSSKGKKNYGIAAFDNKHSIKAPRLHQIK